MSEGVGIIIAVAIIAFLVWLVGKLISIALFLVLVVPIYIVLAIYTSIKFIAMTTFIAIDTLFHLGFDMPVLAVWIFWGLVIGAAIQGCREMKIYGRKGTGVLIAIAPVLLLTLVGAIKINRGSLIDVEANAAVAPSDASIPESMVLIPAGEFQMGSSNGKTDEGPIHTVYVDAFYMDKYEVTNREYADFLNTTSKHVSDSTAQSDPTDMYADRLAPVGSRQIAYIDGQYSAKPGYENHPVSGVTWYGAMAYAVWVGKRLPTEAEWEKAARGELVGMTYPWGNTIDGSHANYNPNISENVVGTTTPVGYYPANGYGLYDMAGNVLEWCLDEYDSDFYAISPDRNPIAGGPITSILKNFTEIKTRRVLRSGSCFDASENLRCASRFYGLPSGHYYRLGFRCVTAVPLPREE